MFADFATRKITEGQMEKTEKIINRANIHCKDRRVRQNCIRMSAF